MWKNEIYGIILEMEGPLSFVILLPYFLMDADGFFSLYCMSSLFELNNVFFSDTQFLDIERLRKPSPLCFLILFDDIGPGMRY